MKKVSLPDNGTDEIHCLLCGTNITNGGELLGECKHLHLVHCSEVEEPIFDRNNIYKDYEDYEDSLHNFLNEKFDDTFVHINVYTPSPGLLECNYVFKLS